MAIARLRMKGPTYWPREYLGKLEYWGWTFDWNYPGYIRWEWKPVSEFYYPPDSQSVLKEFVYCADELHKGPPYREGGPLNLERQKITLTTIKSGVWELPGVYKYTGRFVTVGAQDNLNTELSELVDPEGASSQGPTCWNKFRPVKPKVDLGTFVGELREFKDLFKVSLKDSKGVAGAYLNYRFGWTPFINDIRKAINLTKNLDRHLSFVRKNNDKWLKRRGTLFDKIETSKVEHPYSRIHPELPGPFYPSGLPPNRCSVTTVTKDRCWFEAMWKYYIPDLSSDKADNIFTSRLLRKLYGLEASAAVAWELLPWSWLVDWFSNIGDNVSNMTNAAYDNLVARYAYVMRHKAKFFITEENVPMNGGPALQYSNTSFCETKQRSAASPFGFSVDWPDFTASQLAILAALGVQRAR